MASAGTSSPSAADTLRYWTREPVRVSIWLKLTDLRDTAVNSLIGMLTSPKLMAPLHMARGMEAVFPEDPQMNRLASVGARKVTDACPHGAREQRHCVVEAALLVLDPLGGRRLQHRHQAPGHQALGRAPAPRVGDALAAGVAGRPHG